MRLRSSRVQRSTSLLVRSSVVATSFHIRTLSGYEVAQRRLRVCLRAALMPGFRAQVLWCFMITPEQFRERLRQPKTPPVDWAKWIGSPTAWLALTISASSLYLTLVRKSDDLRVVVSHRHPMSIWLGTPGSQIELREPDQTLIFINSGNRAAAINEIKLLLWFQSANSPPSTCSKPSSWSLTLSYDFAPLVIKPGEITSLSVNKFKATKFSMATDKKDRKLEYEVSDGDLKAFSVVPEPTTGDLLVACQSFQVILPDSESQSANLPLGNAMMLNFGSTGPTASFPGAFHDFRAPVILIKQ
jgi:hypothetical protein